MSGDFFSDLQLLTSSTAWYTTLEPFAVGWPGGHSG